MIESSRASWYVVQAQPRAEMKAVTHLTRQGFEVYLPRFLKKRRHARRVENVSMPLFPGYLFIIIDMATQRWRCVNSTIGVHRLVCNGNTPALVDSRTINALRGRHDERGFITLDRPRFIPGDKMRVTDGVFSESLGIYEGMTDQQRIKVLLELLGRKVRVHIDIDSVVAA